MIGARPRFTRDHLRAAPVVLLPIFVMALWVGYHLARMLSGEVVELKVKPFDPRDVLAGHYLLYTVDYGAPVCPDGYGVPRCVCLSKSGSAKIATASWSGRCEDRPQDCRLWLRGTCRGRRFEAGIERFSISESRAHNLPRVPSDARIAIRLDGRGNGFPTELLSSQNGGRD